MTAPLDLQRIEELEHVIGGDLATIVAGIARSLQTALDDVARALEGNDLSTAARAAHAGRNDALTIGADPLLAALTDVETASRDSRAGAAGEAFARAESLWPATREALGQAASTPTRGDILIVDDHDLSRRLLERLLARDGHAVRSLASLAAAEQALAERRPALIVLDLSLPDGDGLELVRRLGQDKPLILACTASAGGNDRERALAAGCDAYVAKPIDTRVFADQVAKLLATAPAGPPAQ